MAVHADFILVKPNGEQVAAVEMKNAVHLTEPLAYTLRDRLLSSGPPATVRFVLVLSQDTGFLFDRDQEDPRPTRSFPLFYVFQSYYPLASPEQRFREEELGILVEKWLRDLAAGKPRSYGAAERALAEAGFLAAVRGSTVVAQAVV